MGSRHLAHSRTSRVGLALVASLTLLAFTSSIARAAIFAYENSQSAAFLGEVRKMKCKEKKTAKGSRFHAGGKTSNGTYGLDITILKFGGFKEYTVPFGVLSPDVNFEGVANDRDYSNVFPFPGGTPPPGGAGVIDFFHHGARVGLGIYSLPSRDYSQGVALSGNAKCI
jgi:hypothetical protein